MILSRGSAILSRGSAILRSANLTSFLYQETAYLRRHLITGLRQRLITRAVVQLGLKIRTQKPERHPNTEFYQAILLVQILNSRG